MRRVLLPAVIFLLVLVGPSYAQTSTGAIAGVVRDPSGAGVAGAEVTVTNEQTGQQRRVTTSDGGRYVAALLVPGTYSIVARSPVFRDSSGVVEVQAGTVATLDLPFDVDTLAEVVRVSAAAPVSLDSHEVVGWVSRTQIDRQPLNGRNTLELVKLEPGITPPDRLSNGRTFVAPLGAGLQTIPRVGFTRVTLDGGNIETPGTVGTLLQISPEVTEQIQVSTVNFDPTIGLATSGAVNVVTRSGGNVIHGGAFSLYRDRQWSAYPMAEATGLATDPSFRRNQAGGTIGGPVRSNRMFFYAGYERHDQRDVIPVVPADPDLRALGGTFASPYSGTLFTARLDVQFADRHRGFIRHTHDANNSFVPSGAPLVLPSGWVRRPIRTRQTLGSLTSVVSTTLVNDVRVSYYAARAAQEPATAADCPASCVGLGAPRILLSDGGPSMFALGTAMSGSIDGYRFQLSDYVAWQRGPHFIRFGLDWEHTEHSQATLESDPVQMILWTPSAVEARAPSLPVPGSLTSLDDILRLPLRSFTTSVGSGEILQRNFQSTAHQHLLRLHAADQWHAGSRLTLTAGLAWSYEPHALNDDLTKPSWLAPLVGPDGLRVPAAHSNVSGMLGFAWKATADGRTVVRGGVGRYVESIARTVALNLSTERVLLSPLGTGRLVVSGSNLFLDGRRLNFPEPTAFTGADLLNVLPALRSNIAASLDPDNRDFGLVNLDRTKEGRNLYDPSYASPRAVHLSLGVQRELGWRIVAGADVAYKRFSHTFINGIDYNRFFSAQGPVIRPCTPAERPDISATCSNGSLFFDTTSGRARYLGVLVRVEKRFEHGVHVLGSYALGSFVGTNGTGTGTSESTGGRVFGFNNDDWSENYGPLPTDFRHVLNLSGTFVVPWDIQISFNLSAYGRPPFAPYVGGMDFNGDGTMNDLLPGTRINQFNRGLDRADLVRLVAVYNEQYAGRLTAGGQLAPAVALPEDFSFGDDFFTLDLRAAREFPLGSHVRLSFFLDVFNALNTQNLTGYGSNLASRESFGQPIARVGQAFGSGGPRSAQVGLRLNF